MNQFLTGMFGPKPATVNLSRRMFLSVCGLLLTVFCLLSDGCSHVPETAAELQKQLPKQYQGELHLQGEADTHRIVIEPHNLNVRDAHHLEFNQVRYQFFNGSSVAAEGEASIRGVISTPALGIEVEEISAGTGEGNGDAMKLGTFQGKLSKDLQIIDATWMTGFGQNVKLTVKAAP